MKTPNIEFPVTSTPAPTVNLSPTVVLPMTLRPVVVGAVLIVKTVPLYVKFPLVDTKSVELANATPLVTLLVILRDWTLANVVTFKLVAAIVEMLEFVAQIVLNRDKELPISTIFAVFEVNSVESK